jgi:Leucine-rich repeat (LRR) protein
MSAEHDVPGALAEARTSHVVRFSGWGLESLPPELSELGDLERMYLVHNDLSQLPVGIGYLHNLTELDVRNNQLTSVFHLAESPLAGSRMLS